MTTQDKVQRFAWDCALGARAPTRAYKGDAGYDLYSNEVCVIQPRETRKISTGVRVIFAPGWWAEIMDRSSLALQGLHTIGGVIDEGYEDYIGVIMFNSGTRPYVVSLHEKVAQLVPRVRYVDPREEELPVRGKKKHGSSGR